MKRVMILGAGKCGRGFIPRFLHDVNLCFCDKDEALIQSLNKQNSYQIHFFNDRPALTINYEECCVFGSEKAHEALIAADILCISIDCSNYADIAVQLNEWIKEREFPLIILFFENAVNAGEKLLVHLDQAAANNCVLLNAGVFTTTENAEGLDMISQDLDYLPIQNSGLILPLKGITRIDDFTSLMKRKLYTYNCLSAVICYLGYLKHYEWLAEAANDAQIHEKLMILLPEMNQRLADYFQLTLAEQQQFAKNALIKFSDPYLKDPISRNARNVSRKLGSDERLYKPLQLLHDGGRDVLLETIAAACVYDFYEETHQGIALLNQFSYTDEECVKIKAYYESFILQQPPANA